MVQGSTNRQIGKCENEKHVNKRLVKVRQKPGLLTFSCPVSPALALSFHLITEQKLLL